MTNLSLIFEFQDLLRALLFLQPKPSRISSQKENDADVVRWILPVISLSVWSSWEHDPDIPSCMASWIQIEDSKQLCEYKLLKPKPMDTLIIWYNDVLELKSLSSQFRTCILIFIKVLIIFQVLFSEKYKFKS